MRLRSWLIPLTAFSLLVGAFALHADASTASKPAPWWARPVPKLAPHAAPSEDTSNPGSLPPALDGQWFKLKVTCKGQAVDSITGATEPRTVKFTSYMQLALNPIAIDAGPGDGGGGGGFPIYNYVVWVQDDLGAWVPSYGDTFFVDGVNDTGDPTVSVNTFMGFLLPSAAIASQHSATLTIKRDKANAFKSAKLKTIGAELTSSTVAPAGLLLGGGIHFYGTMSISGSTLPVEKLPFTPT